MIIKNCLTCRREFEVKSYQIKIGNGKYCSHKCASQSLIGKPSWNKDKRGIYSKETLEKMSQARLGQNPWNKGKHTGIKTFEGKKHTEQSKKKISLSKLGKPFLAMRGIKNPNWKGGKPKCSDCNKQLTQYTAIYCKNHARMRERNWNWQGGLTKLNAKIRNSFEYEEWRKSVFERDNYTCQHCGQIGGYLHADHIKPFSLFPDLRFELSNGRTLCLDCHKKTGTWGVNREQAGIRLPSRL